MVTFTTGIGKYGFRFVDFDGFRSFEDFVVASWVADLLSGTVGFHFVNVMFAFEDDFRDELVVVVV